MLVFGLLGLSLSVACSSGTDPHANTGGGGHAAGTGGGGGAAPAGDWGCLGGVTWPAPTGASVAMTFEATSLPAVTNLGVKVCPADATDCANPLDKQSSAGNTVNVTVPTPAPSGFLGYFEVSSDAAPVNLKHFLPPISHAGQYSGDTYTFYLISDAYISQIEQSLGAAQDPARGALGFQSKDCANATVGGVEFTLDGGDASTKRFYLVGTTALASATQTDVGGAAIGGFLNVPPGEVTLSAKVAATGKAVGTFKLRVRAGAVSTVDFGPVP